jgi:hypothetical protein
MGVAWLVTCGISFTPIPFLPVTSMESCERMGFYEELVSQRQCVRLEMHLIQNLRLLRIFSLAFLNVFSPSLLSSSHLLTSSKSSLEFSICDDSDVPPTVSRGSPPTRE